MKTLKKESIEKAQFAPKVSIQKFDWIVPKVQV